jgi:multidrug efflux pump subunit AcrA (membrane-fusion protein)
MARLRFICSFNLTDFSDRLLASSHSVASRQPTLPAPNCTILVQRWATLGEQKRVTSHERRRIDAQREELERQRLQIEQQKREQEAQRLRDEAQKRRQQDEIDQAQQEALTKQRELDQQRRKVSEDEQARKKAVEERRYTGPSSGSLTWEGQVDGLQLVEIENGSANVGTVNGTLPGVACMIQPSDAKRVMIADPPRPANGFNRLVFRVQGKGHVSVRFSWVVQ